MYVWIVSQVGPHKRSAAGIDLKDSQDVDERDATRAPVTDNMRYVPHSSCSASLREGCPEGGSCAEGLRVLGATALILPRRAYTAEGSSAGDRGAGREVSDVKGGGEQSKQRTYKTHLVDIHRLFVSVAVHKSEPFCLPLSAI